MASLTFTTATAELKALNSTIVKQDPQAFAKLIELFVHQGSQLHVLHTTAITVYYNPVGTFDNVPEEDQSTATENKMANSIIGLMAAGARFFDAVIYLSLQTDKKPAPKEHAKGSNGTTIKYPVFNDIGRITQYLFATYFFIMIRAHPPTESGDYAGQPMPKFISTVLGIKEDAGGIAEYLASFNLSDLSPHWVRHISVKGLSQEAATRFGLGVAGYRVVSVFNVIVPDKYRTTPDAETVKPGEEGRELLSKKPAYLDDAVAVARSFKMAGMCWDFHPATRSPNVLTTYGNVNKNASNLIIDCYKKDTIDKLVKLKKLAVPPTFDESYTDYQSWSSNMAYTATARIFPTK